MGSGLLVRIMILLLWCMHCTRCTVKKEKGIIDGVGCKVLYEEGLNTVFAHLLLEETFSYVQSNEYLQKSAHWAFPTMWIYSYCICNKCESIWGIALPTYARVERGFLRGIGCIITILWRLTTFDYSWGRTCLEISISSNSRMTSYSFRCAICTL
jgi:hypothetical protein